MSRRPPRPTLFPYTTLSRSRGDGGDGHRVEGAGADGGVGDLGGLLAVVGLGEVEVLEVHADGLGVGRVEGVLGVYEGGEAAGLLGLGDDVQGEGRLAAGLGAVDLDDAPPGDAADAEGEVQGEGAGGDGGHLLRPPVAHAHDRALTVRLLYLRDGGAYRPIPVVRHPKFGHRDRKSTRLNSSHANISYAVFCLKKKKNLQPAAM